MFLPFSSFLLVTLVVVIFSNIAPALADTQGIASVITFTPGHNTGCGAYVNTNEVNGIVVPKSFWNSIPGSQGGYALCGKCVVVENDDQKTPTPPTVTVPIASFCEGNCGSAPNDIQLTAKTFKALTGGRTTGTMHVKYTYSPNTPQCT